MLRMSPAAEARTAEADNDRKRQLDSIRKETKQSRKQLFSFEQQVGLNGRKALREVSSNELVQRKSSSTQSKEQSLDTSNTTAIHISGKGISKGTNTERNVSFITNLIFLNKIVPMPSIAVVSSYVSIYTVNQCTSSNEIVVAKCRPPSGTNKVTFKDFARYLDKRNAVAELRNDSSRIYFITPKLHKASDTLMGLALGSSQRSSEVFALISLPKTRVVSRPLSIQSSTGSILRAMNEKKKMLDVIKNVYETSLGVEDDITDAFVDATRFTEKIFDMTQETALSNVIEMICGDSFGKFPSSSHNFVCQLLTTQLLIQINTTKGLSTSSNLLLRSLASPTRTTISSGLTTTTNTTQALVQALPSSDSTQAEPPPSVLRLLPLPLTSLVDEKTEIKSLAIAKAAVDLPILLAKSQEGMKTSDIFREFPNVDSVVVRSLLKSVASVDPHTKHWSVVSRQAILNQTQDEVLSVIYNASLLEVGSQPIQASLSMLAYLDLKNVSKVEALDAVKRVIWGIEESRRFPVHRIVEYKGPLETEDDRIEREMYSNELRSSDDIFFNPRLAVYFECISELLRRGDPISIAIAHCMLQWSRGLITRDCGCACRPNYEIADCCSIKVANAIAAGLPSVLVLGSHAPQTAGVNIPSCATTFPSTLIDIGERSFAACVHLNKVVLNDGLKKIGQSAFNSCHSLQTIKLPSTLIELGVGSFLNCTRLNKVILNEGLKIIEHQLFSYCSSLESIKLPSTVVSIGVKGFFGCSHLKRILLNDGLKRIWADAFGECTSLKRINLPFTITKIDPSAFSGNNSLIEVLINESIQDSGANTFNVKILPCAELQPLASSCRNLQRFKFASLSARLENIIQRGYWSEIEDKIDANSLDGVIERSGSGELFISKAVIRQGNDNTWKSVQRSFNQIARLVSNYEMREATIQIDLALWKCKINQTSAISSSDREACRVDMPGPAKDMILQYLWG